MRMPKTNKRQLQILHSAVSNEKTIQDSNYHLTLHEEELLLNLIQRADFHKSSPSLQFNAKSYAKFFGLNNTSINAEKVGQDLEKLNSHTFWLQYQASNGHHCEWLIHWLSWVDLNEATGVFTVKLNQRIRPFLMMVRHKLNHNHRGLAK